MQLVHIKTLSLWEIAHYWHDLDPRESTTHKLPLKAQNTLRALSMWCGKKLAYRVENDKAYLHEIYQHAPRYTARHYRSTFKKAIDNKYFGKQFFSRLHISRSQLARLCLQHNELLPGFWFPDNDNFPYDLTGDLTDEVTVEGRYKLILIYDDSEKLSNTENGSNSSQSVTTTVIQQGKFFRGITKNEVISAFDGLHFDAEQWSKYLASPPKWLEECRVAMPPEKGSSRFTLVVIRNVLRPFTNMRGN
jgi:hypothetical protein